MVQNTDLTKPYFLLQNFIFFAVKKIQENKLKEKKFLFWLVVWQSSWQIQSTHLEMYSSYDQCSRHFLH